MAYLGEMIQPLRKEVKPLEVIDMEQVLGGYSPQCFLSATDIFNHKLLRTQAKLFISQYHPDAMTDCTLLNCEPK